MKRIVYWIVQKLVYLGLHAYFNKIEINGAENVPDPKTTPFIYAPNHQSAFMDALVVGGLSPVPVNYLTRSDIFVPPWTWILDALNMIAIYRMRDGYGKLGKNDAVFETCIDLFKNRKPVLIFPEGNQGRHYYLRPLTKGTARLAMQAQENLDVDLKVLPVGINYFRHDYPRHKLILNFGKPINVSAYMAQYQNAKPRALNDFRTELSDSLKSLMVIPEETENYEDADILMVSDFIVYKLGDDIQKLIKHNQVNKNTQFHSLGIGNQYNEDVLHYFDSNWHYKPAEKGIIRSLTRGLQDIGLRM